MIQKGHGAARGHGQRKQRYAQRRRARDAEKGPGQKIHIEQGVQQAPAGPILRLLDLRQQILHPAAVRIAEIQGLLFLRIQALQREPFQNAAIPRQDALPALDQCGKQRHAQGGSQGQQRPLPQQQGVAPARQLVKQPGGEKSGYIGGQGGEGDLEQLAQQQPRYHRMPQGKGTAGAA